MLRRCTRFKHWIENNGLIDLGFSGPKFTWTRGLNRETRKEARLDRALCNMDWRVRFQEGAVRHLLKACSDHSPLLIAPDGFTQTIPCNKPFRFHAAWMYHNRFEDFVRDKWIPQGQLVHNLSNLASELSVWNQEVLGNLFRRKRRLWARIEGIQRRLDSGAPRYLLKLESRLRQELNQTLDQIAVMWFQKARMDQLRDRDRNTKYFHMSTIIRRCFNRIEALRDRDNLWCTKEAMIQRLWWTTFRTSSRLLLLDPPLLGPIILGSLPCRRMSHMTWRNHSLVWISNWASKRCNRLKHLDLMVFRLFSINGTGISFIANSVRLCFKSCKEVPCRQV